ncbi:transketolase family protein [Cetobacterium sp. SF1]|uniref:transketolase family protein n=1 Tax=unclassified Cetobacterium TaxID=2630983 RepID=UPI003CF8927C
MEEKVLKSTRDAFGEVLVELGYKNENIISLSGDLQDSTKAIEFQKIFPERFFNVGIAEQNLIEVASGLSLEGYIPIVSSFAAFITTRPYDQIRILCCYNNLNIKIIGTHSGLTVGEDGGTAQSLEDIGVMRVLPNMKVFQPCDFNETKAILKSVLEDKGSCYIRLARASYPQIYDENKIFEIGKSDILVEGKDCVIFATGFMVHKALEVEKKLKEKGIFPRIINISSIKPLDKKLIIESARLLKKVITIEEHQKSCGMGASIAEVLAEYGIPIKIIGIDDLFGQSGNPEILLKNYGLGIDNIAEIIESFLGNI